VSGATLSLAEGEPKRRPARGDYLFRVLVCDAPSAPPGRFALGGFERVRLGRGEFALGRSEGETLLVESPDRWMSSHHAELQRDDKRWLLEDAGSKNGTRVNGARVDRVALADGDLVELGHSFFSFREGLEPPPPPSERVPAALRTLLPGFETAVNRLIELAATTIPVVLRGESGTGKELAARALHALSGRAGELVAVNSGALPDSLIESELFGYKKGAFSGALEDRPGLVRSADRGTLFLDEIGDLPPPSQATLLRVLQESEVRPVGATRPVKVDLRVVAATHRDLERMAADGAFRADLLARLSGFVITLPPLRDRREDLGLLAAALLPPSARLSPTAARALFDHDWPANVRELGKCLVAAAVFAGDGEIELEHLPPALRGAAAEPAALSPDDARQRDALVASLREHRGNLSAVARAMGKARNQIQRWVRRYQLDPDRFKGD
jgi:transcriptional regulator of acetoin/glycerol metabolism